MKVRDVIKRIEADGWRHARTKGDQRVFKHLTKPGNVVVSGHLSIDVPAGTLANVWRQAGLKP